MNEVNYNVGRDMYASAYSLKYSDGDFSLERTIPTINLSDSDKLHIVKEGETLQSIAYQYFGDSGYWYWIAEANFIMNPFDSTELYKGKRLIIPLYGINE